MSLYSNPWWILFNLINFILCIDHTYYLRRDNSLIAPYTNINSWMPIGSTFFTSNFIRLTGAIKGSHGAIYNIQPLTSTDWEVQIAFKVHGSTGSMFGDGFSFWLVQEKGVIGKAFGGPEIFRGLAVFFDTYRNSQDKSSHDFPYISAMISNGSQTFDHDLDGIKTQLAGCYSDFRNKPHGNIVAIKYSKNILSVKIDVNSQNKWKDCFHIDGVYLPTEYFLGLSAATGDLTDTHDIHFLKTYELDVEHTAEELLTDLRNIEPHVEKADELLKNQFDASFSTGWSSWGILLPIICILVLCGLIFWIYSIYRRNRSRRRRLY